MPETMKVTQEPDFGPRTMRVHGSLLVLALLAFAVGGTSGLVGAVFRLVLERSDRFRDAVIDWAHDKEIAGLALVIGISGVPTGLAAWLVRSQQIFCLTRNWKSCCGRIGAEGTARKKKAALKL